MSTKGFLIDASVRRQVFLERYSNGRIAELNKIMQAMVVEVNGLLSSSDIDNRQIFDQLIHRINRALRLRFEEIRDSILESVKGATEAELSFFSNLMEDALKVVPITPTFAAVESAIFSQVLAALDPDNALTLDEAISQFERKKMTEIRRLINDGLLEGKTTQEMTRNLTALVETRQRHQAESLIRTAVNHASSMTRRTAFRSNPGIVNGYQWVSTLDSRTTLICAGRDGRVFSIKSNIYPPAHWSCRSTTIPLIGDEFDKANLKGDRPQKGDATGTVSANTNFDSWLRRQSASFQDEYFSQFSNGEELAKLFRQGKMPIQKFRNELGKQYTLDELRQLDPIAFDRANIETPSGG